MSKQPVFVIGSNRNYGQSEKGVNKGITKKCIEPCFVKGCFKVHEPKENGTTNSVKFAVSADEFVPKLPECGSIVLEFKQAPPAPPKVEDFSKYMPSNDEGEYATAEDVSGISCDIQALHVVVDALNEKVVTFIEPMDTQVGNITRKTSEQAKKIALLESTVRNQEGKIDLLERMNKSMQVYSNLMQGEIRVIKERLDQHDKERLAQPNK